jgi:hypothetical protein
MMTEKTMTDRERLAEIEAYNGELSETITKHLEREIALEAERDALREQVATLRDALGVIVKWGGAYPLDIFLEPDFAKAHELLQAGGMTLDAISASVARRLARIPVGYAETALAATEEKQP